MKQIDYVKRIIEQEGLDGFLITSRPNTFYLLILPVAHQNAL